jgi:hypothetical protein
VNVHGPLNDRIRRSCIHHVKDRVNGLVAARARDCSSQDLASWGIHDDFHKPLRLALLNDATNLRHRPPANPRGATAFANFFFLSEARTAERWIHVQSTGCNAVADFARVIVQKIRADDFSIIKAVSVNLPFPLQSLAVIRHHHEAPVAWAPRSIPSGHERLVGLVATKCWSSRSSSRPAGRTAPPALGSMVSA